MKLSVAPMIDWTDRHCRRFHRAISKKVWLYTEMITTGALIHGDKSRFLAYSPEEHPVVFQLGGSDPFELAQCAQWVEAAGFDEINLNCGCPSDRVQKGAFGACLMATPTHVADCIKAMRDACSINVTVKHRIGLDYSESTQMLYDFVGALHQAGCDTFIVHARNAVLKGLSPKQNREIPPLRYEVVRALKYDFPKLKIVLNGGIKTIEAIKDHLEWADGCMIGREAFTNPWLLSQFDGLIDSEHHDAVQIETSDLQARLNVILGLRPYVEEQLNQGVPLRSIVASWLGLFNGLPGARLYRQVLSDSAMLKQNNWDVVESALAVLDTRDLTSSF